MPSILECNRIVGCVYPYSLNFATLFASHLSSILALFFSKSLVKLLLHDGQSSILTQVLLFHQLFHCHKCSEIQMKKTNKRTNEILWKGRGCALKETRLQCNDR